MFFNGGTELLVFKEVYASTWMSYHDLLARTQDPSLAERRYYESLLTDQAGDVIRYMLNDTLHNYLDSLAAWSLRLNTPAGDWYAADVYRNLGYSATTTSIVNAIGIRYSGIIDPSGYNEHKTLFGLIGAAQSALLPAASLASYVAGSPGYVRSLATAFQVSRGECHDPYYWVGSVSFRSAEEESPTKPTPKLTVYPNPTTGLITVDLSAPVSGGILTLYGPLGDVIVSRPINNNQASIQLDLSGRPSGQYYVSLHKDDGEVIKTSFMIIK
ncbi:MAG: T9SS type A sorting domain-containing protein [Saprospiraceae bacterium]|jgi:hypothetical protein|nr:T9SS type A sorting domain-containing protein [Saprospiraceae bacterium]